MFFKSKKSPRRDDAKKGVGEPSYIGRDMTIEGQIICEGELHIDGNIRGSVRAQLCVIDVNGVVQGDVAADVIHVRGRIIGPVHGRSVFIHAGAHVQGDVFNDTISIENGAYVYGSIRHNTAPVAETLALPSIAPGAAPMVGDAAVTLDPKQLRVIQTRR